MTTDRRSFIKYASALLGGSVLAACSDQTASLVDRLEDAQVPIQTANAYRFYTLKRDGDLLPDGRTIDSLRYDAVISDNGQIAYTAFDKDGKLGLYRLSVDATGAEPRILEERVVVREGDELNGGIATPVGGYHINANGDVIIALETMVGEPIDPATLEPHYDIEFLEESGFPGPDVGDPDNVYDRQNAVYRMTATGAAEVLVQVGTVTSEGHEIFGNFGPAVVNGQELLFTATVKFHHAESDAYELGQGVLYVEDMRAGPESAIVVQRTGGLPGGAFHSEEISSESVVQLFGLIDLQPGGAYCVQAHTALPSRMEDEERPEGEQVFLGSLLLSGNASEPGSAVVLAAPREIGIEPANTRDRVGLGMVMHGPRMGPNGRVGTVLTLSEDSQRLYYGGQLVASSGDVSPGGFTIESFLTPVFGPEGEMFVTAQTTDSMELMLFDGVTLRTLLRTNDMLVGENTPIALIALGTLVRHVNRDAQLAFTIVREDGTTALVLGIPA